MIEYEEYIAVRRLIRGCRKDLTISQIVGITPSTVARVRRFLRGNSGITTYLPFERRRITEEAVERLISEKNEMKLNEK